MKTGFWKIVYRSIRLRCPRCGQGKLFRDYLRMNPGCRSCHLKYDREPGYFLGSIYFNYGVTALLVTIGYFTCYFSGLLTGTPLLVSAFLWSVLFPLWFFRYARSLWVGFDQYFDPEIAADESSRKAQK